MAKENVAIKGRLRTEGALCSNSGDGKESKPSFSSGGWEDRSMMEEGGFPPIATRGKVRAADGGVGGRKMDQW